MIPLESALADIDVESILGGYGFLFSRGCWFVCWGVNDLEQFMPGYGADGWSDSGHHDFQYEVSRVVEGLSTELRRRFGQWIRQLPIPSRTTPFQRLQTRRSCCTLPHLQLHVDTAEPVRRSRSEGALHLGAPTV